MATPSLYAVASAIPTLFTSSQLANGANTVYTVPSNKAIKVAKMTLTNVSAAAVVVTVNVVPTGGSTTTSNEIIHAYSLAASDTLIISELEDIYLGDGDSIRVNAGAATSVDVMISGLLFT